MTLSRTVSSPNRLSDQRKAGSILELASGIQPPFSNEENDQMGIP